MRPSVLVALSVLLAGGCGHSASPSASTSAHVLTILSGDGGTPVPGAQVRIGGRELRTDAGGRVAVTDRDRGPIDVEASGFLLRESRITGSEQSSTLWPVDTAYTPEYVRTLLYAPAHLTRETAPPESTFLVRVLARRVAVIPSPELFADAAARRAHFMGAASVTAATDGEVVFGVEGSPSSPVAFRTSLDPSASSDALTYRDLKAGAVVGGRILFKSLAAARDPGFLAHELGHALGLQHSTVRSDVMYFYCGGKSSYDFSASERRTIRLLLQRPPGNQFPDNDRSTGMGLSATSDLLIERPAH